jgi:hypothetical protein
MRRRLVTKEGRNRFCFRRRQSEKVKTNDASSAKEENSFAAEEQKHKKKKKKKRPKLAKRFQLSLGGQTALEASRIRRRSDIIQEQYLKEGVEKVTADVGSRSHELLE